LGWYEQYDVYGSKQINSPGDAAIIAKDFLAGADRENFVVLCLDTKSNVNAINTISITHQEVVSVEQRFKEKLGTRAFGLNGN